MNWFWRVYYFEAGAELPYRSRRFFTRSHLQCAMARFSRMGGDDVLQVIPPCGFVSQLIGGSMQ
jgi:hypothetical protein